MTDNNHPITPTPELVQQWLEEYYGTRRTGEVNAVEQHLATQAARWGADQKLEACCEWFSADRGYHHSVSADLRAGRRPKPPTLKEQALALLHKNKTRFAVAEEDVILLALESLPD